MNKLGTIMLAGARDLSAMVALLEAARSTEVVRADIDRVGRRDMEYAIRLSNAVVAEENGEGTSILGFAVGTAEQRNFRILALVVGEEHRRKGLGSDLLEALIALAPRETRSVVARAPSREATSFFYASGFLALDGQFWRDRARPEDLVPRRPR